MKPNLPLLSLAIAAFIVTSACMPSEHLPRDHLSREVVLDDLKSPWGMAFLDEDRVLITEKEGGLILANVATGTRREIEGLPDDLFDEIRRENPFDNSGLFDIALDPNFPRDPWVYLAYSASHNEGLTTKVIRGRFIGDRLDEIETVLVAEPFTEDEYFHFGGGLAFGADRKLYITVGERLYNERDNPPTPIAQDVTDRRGKIYRLNPDGSIPKDNPDFGDGSASGLFAIGIRAAQGITLNAGTGELWFSEHGSRQGDEINRLVAGANYGWPLVTTGGYRNDDFVPPDTDETLLQAPEWSWAQTVAPTGLVFYTGDVFPEWNGDLFVSGLSRGSFWRFNFEQDHIISVEELFVNDRVRSRDVATAPDGSLYMLTDTLLVSNTEGGLENTGLASGQLLKIVP